MRTAGCTRQNEKAERKGGKGYTLFLFRDTEGTAGGATECSGRSRKENDVRDPATRMIDDESLRKQLIWDDAEVVRFRQLARC